MPRVSVIMPAYNAAAYAGAAIESVLAQSFPDFEFIIVDDGSTDATPGILDRCSAQDSRIRLIRNESNLGLIRSLNAGLEEAAGDLIARIDADDLCRPERLERQVSFLDAHPDHVLVGASYQAIDEDGRVLWSKVTGLDDAQARWVARFRTPLGHSGALFRRVAPDGLDWRYDERFEAIEDYDLWQRMMETGRAAVLPEVLFAYRIHRRTITATMGPTMALNILKVALRNARSALPAHLVDDFSIFLKAYLTRERVTRQDIIKCVSAFDELLQHDIAAFPRHERWFRKQTAGVMAQGILERGGAGRNWRLLQTFVSSGWRHFPWLLARTVEDKGSALLLLRHRAFGR